MKKTIQIILVVAAIITPNGFAGVSSPYTPDTDTLHLYHFDGNGDDAVTIGAIDLILINGATATDSSVAGFNTALNSYDDTTGDAPSAAAPENISAVNFVGADDAFTFEAIIQPFTALGAQLNDMQIISGEGDDSDNRCWQFRINTSGQLQFLNLANTWWNTTESFYVDIPTTGDHAYLPGQWYHVAVTYNGNEDTANNLKMYWTKLDSDSSEANLLASFRMEYDITGEYGTPQLDFAIGNEGRDTFGFSENFEGLIDEARISSIARQPNDMLIIQGIPSPVIISGPNDVAVNQTQSVIFETVFTSESTPSAVWYKVASPADLFMDPAEANIDVQLTYDAQSEEYTSILTMTNVMTLDTGQYYCQILNDSGFPQNSNAANLLVYGLVAHWTMNQDRYADGNYLEETAGFNATVAGIPTFVTGADGAQNSAALISASDGWAVCPVFDPVRQTGQMSISFWAKWGQIPGTQDDLTAESTNGETLVMSNGLKADGQWQHICTVFDGTTGKLYVDGVLRDQVDWQLPADTEASINLGISSDSLNAFSGARDDVRLYNYALSEYDVADLRYALSSERSCILAFDALFDLSGPQDQPDCMIDLYDLTAFANQWLTMYDFTDFTDLSSAWQSSGLYPGSE